MNKPLKRVQELQDLSRDHHQGLLLCWKIRAGFNKAIEPSRIMNYVNWFYDAHLIEHFKIEEELVFPILGNENKLVKKALSEHRKLKRLIEEKNNLKVRLNSIEKLVEKHIRFEERQLFMEVQNVATKEELAAIKAVHSQEKFRDNLTDQFWS